MGIEKVPELNWEKECCTGTYRLGHIYRGTEKVPRNKWAMNWCLGTYGHREGAWKHY